MKRVDWRTKVVGQESGADGRIAQLRDYFAQELPATDADFCFRWLAASALAPLLRWELTAALGNALATADGRQPPDEDLFLLLARLPWFRAGRMPEDLRNALARTLNKADRLTAQSALSDAFDEALREPGTLPHPRRARLGAHLARLISQLPDGEFADPLLANGLRGRRPGDAMARVSAARQRLPATLRRWTDPPLLIAAGAGLLASLAAAILLARSEILFPPREAHETATVSVVNLLLTACEGPAVEWGQRPRYDPGPLRLDAPLAMRRLGGEASFRSALLAPDLSALMTWDARSTVTLWSLTGDGARVRVWPHGEPTRLGKTTGGSIYAGTAGRLEKLDGPTESEASRSRIDAAPASVSLSDAEGHLVVAALERRSIVIRNAKTHAELSRMEAQGSPLLGVGRTDDGKLVVARCNPKGKVIGIVIPGNPPVKAPPGKTPTPAPTPCKGADCKGRPPVPDPTPSPGPTPCLTAICEERDPSTLSGAAWWKANQANFQNSASISDLVSPFRENVQAFIGALEKGGASVRVTATRRNLIRAHLSHYSWRVAKGTIDPAAVPPMAGVTINWDHGDPARSRQAAQEMVDLFQIAFQPSLTSTHIDGRAIDMQINWKGRLNIADANGKVLSIGAPYNGETNELLHQVGATYGVRKLLSDPPHWSDDGR